MSIPTTQSPETESDRQQRLHDLLATYGPNWGDQYKPGSFGCHELLDRTVLAAELVERYVLSHPSCIQDPEWYGLADQAVTALQRLYQCIGAAHVDSEDDPLTN